MLAGAVIESKSSSSVTMPSGESPWISVFATRLACRPVSTTVASAGPGEAMLAATRSRHGPSARVSA